MTHSVKKSQKVSRYEEELNPLFTYFKQYVQCSSTSSYDILFNNMEEEQAKLQRRAARVITGQSYEVRSTQILESINWIPIEDTLKNREITMTFKALTNRLPVQSV